MPEIKHTFTGGKMNKDLDERLVQNGEYRDAMNIQVRTTDGSDSGSIQNIKGNTLVPSGDNYDLQSAQSIIGSISDEKNDDAYFFLSTPPLVDFFNIENLSGAEQATQIQIALMMFATNGPLGFVDNIIRVRATGSAPVQRQIFVDNWMSLDLPSNVLLDDGESAPWQSGGSWFQIPLNPNWDSSSISVGMTMKAMDSDNNDLFNNAKIKWIGDVSGESFIVLYDEQDYGIDDGNIVYFKFEKPKVLEFEQSNINGINIIDDLLLWTSGTTEPKKININRSLQGTLESITNSTPTTNLMLSEEFGISDTLSEVGDIIASTSAGVTNDIKKEHITVIKKSPRTAPTLHMSNVDRSLSLGDISYNLESFVFENADDALVSFGDIITIGDATSDDFSGTNFLSGDTLTITQDDPDVSDPIVLKAQFICYLDSDGDETSTPSIDIQIQMLAIDSDLTLSAFDWTIELEQSQSLFETKFGRFGYRYKYEDGEYSTFSPWSELAFLPGKFDYLPKKGYNLGMSNDLRRLTIKDFIPLNSDRPLDVVGIDILFKSTDNQNVYTVKSIIRDRDAEWVVFTPDSNEDTTTLDELNLATGELTITSEMIHSAVEANQLLRAWDNVPRYALAQEITGNRLLFANYIQGYDVGDQVNLSTSIISSDTATVNRPRKSIKSIRNYKLGMVFGDEYGRETPVIESGYTTGSNDSTGEVVDGGFYVEKQFASLRNNFRLKQSWGIDGNAEPPSWAEYVKYYIKETTNEYYNLVMDRWYNAEDGNIWISFHSADRNKVDEETYLILKNQNGSNTPVQEKARYKIIAIENEAPDFIKIDNRTMGSIPLVTDTWEVGLFTDDSLGITGGSWPTPVSTNSPDALMSATSIKIPNGQWDGLLNNYKVKGTLKLRIIGRTQDAAGGTINQLTTPWVTVSNFKDGDTAAGGDDDTQIFWNDPFNEQANMYQRFTTLGYATTDSSGLGVISYLIEFKEEVVENKPEFDGRFFVKIEKDITIEENIMLLTPASTEWETLFTYNVGFISTQALNPAENGPYSVSEATGSASEQTAKTTWGGQMDKDGATVGEWVNDNNADGWQTATSGYDLYNNHIDNFAIGCGGTSDQDDGQTANVEVNTGEDDWYMWAGYYTKKYWEDRKISLLDDDPINHSNAVFIDGARAARFMWSTCSNFDVCGEDSAEYLFGLNMNPTLLDSYTFHSPISNGNFSGYKWGSAEYHRPRDLDLSVYKADGETYMDSSTEVQETVNRIHFSVVVDDSGWDTDTSSSAPIYKQFKGNMKIGNRFKFTEDINDDVYIITRVDSSAPGKSRNYLAGSDQGGDWNNSWNDAYWHKITGDGTIGSQTGCNEGSGGDSCFEYVPTWDIDGDRYFRADCGICTDNGNNDTDGFLMCHRESYRIQFAKVDPTTGNQYGDERGMNLSTWDPRGVMRHDGSTVTTIEVLSKITTSGGVAEVPETAACWETEPKENVDIDIYYEASDAIPMTLKEGNTLSFVPIKSKVGVIAIEEDNSETVIDITYAGSSTSTENHHVSNVDYTATTSLIEVTSTDVQSGITGPQIRNIGIGDYLTFERNDGTKTTSVVTNFYVRDTTPLEDEDGNITYAMIPQTIYSGFLYWDPAAGGGDGGAVWGGAWNGDVISDNEDTQVIGITPGTVPNHIFAANFSGSANDVWLNDNQWLQDLTTSVGGANVYFVRATGWYEIDGDVWQYPIKLGWNNCYSFGNGLESDRIRDDFNAPQIDNGVKVSSTFLGYGVEKKTSGIIHSGIYNSTSEVNNLNEFNMAESITKDLNPSYGSIQALKTRDTDVVVFTEDKVLKVLANKDAIYNAEGNEQLIATNRVLGTATPFQGDYGISNNPESLTVDQFRMYFTDKQRGAVLRLSGDGLTPISNVGMKTWFRDNLKTADSLLGTFDIISGEYNLTLNGNNSKTISFNEGSKGWISFKSFIPEQGISVSDKYYTGKNGKIYYHHSESAEKNTFYGNFAESSFKVLFNDNPSSVKSFHTINYEGTQSKIEKYTGSEEVDAAGNVVITPGYTNVNDGEYYNLDEKFGWYVNSFETDMQSGRVKEFINKENKWFNKIIGLETNLNNLDTNEFSVQGLGIPSTATCYDSSGAVVECNPEPCTSCCYEYVSLEPLQNPIASGGDIQFKVTISNTPYTMQQAIDYYEETGGGIYEEAYGESQIWVGFTLINDETTLNGHDLTLANAEQIGLNTQNVQEALGLGYFGPCYNADGSDMLAGSADTACFSGADFEWPDCGSGGTFPWCGLYNSIMDQTEYVSWDGGGNPPYEFYRAFTYPSFSSNGFQFGSVVYSTEAISAPIQTVANCRVGCADVIATGQPCAENGLSANQIATGGDCGQSLSDLSLFTPETFDVTSVAVANAQSPPTYSHVLQAYEIDTATGDAWKEGFGFRWGAENYPTVNTTPKIVKIKLNDFDSNGCPTGGLTATLQVGTGDSVNQPYWLTVENDEQDSTPNN